MPGGAYWPDGIQGDADAFWTATKVSDLGNLAWCVDFNPGDIDVRNLAGTHPGSADKPYARCVR